MRETCSVAGANAQSGIKGSGRDIGVHGEAPIGVYGEGAVGGVFSGTDAAVSLTPAAAAGPPSGVAVKGDLMVDSTGVLHLCVADGTPGTWIAVSHGGVRFLASPQRAFSSVEKLTKQETRTIQIIGVVPGVPDNAIGIVGNLTIHQTHGGGYVTAFPAGTDRPLTSSINWGAPGQSIANAVSIRLGPTGAIALFADATVPDGSEATHAIVDITGYVL